MYLRCFIAIDITEMIKEEIGELIEILRRYLADEREQS